MSEQAPAEPKRSDVLKQVEGEYFLDYAIFTGAVREYVSRTLEMQFRSDPTDWHRRLFLIAVFREEYSTYEDLGALLAPSANAFARCARNSEYPKKNSRPARRCTAITLGASNGESATSESWRLAGWLRLFTRLSRISLHRFGTSRAAEGSGWRWVISECVGRSGSRRGSCLENSST
jgi:hypothetical protein